MKLSIASISISCTALLMVSADLGTTKEDQLYLNKKESTHASQPNHHNGDSASADLLRRPGHDRKFSFDESLVESLEADKKNDIVKEGGVNRQLETDDAVILSDQDHKIFGGDEVNPPLKYPFMVRTNGCGGSLVAPNVVLTAAHCRPNIMFRPVVKIGKHDLTNNQEDYEEFDIEDFVVHEFNDGLTGYDYMMLKLSGSSKFQPVELDDGTDDFAQRATVMGWGYTACAADGGERSDVLRSVDVDVYSEKDCKSLYTDSNFGSNVEITDQNFCAGAPGKDTRQGDSGGPIIDIVTGKQIGIVSTGLGCVDAEYPGVYAKVRDQIDWIQSHISNWAATPPAPTPTPIPYCLDAYHWQDSGGKLWGCDYFEAKKNSQCVIDGEEIDGTDGYGDGMTANEACCYCGGGTGCSDIVGKKFAKKQCNKTPGCSYNQVDKVCVDALSNDKCVKYTKKGKCLMNGCKWEKKKKNGGKKKECFGRWDY